MSLYCIGCARHPSASTRLMHLGLIGHRRQRLPRIKPLPALAAPVGFQSYRSRNDIEPLVARPSQIIFRRTPRTLQSPSAHMKFRSFSVASRAVPRRRSVRSVSSAAKATQYASGYVHQFCTWCNAAVNRTPVSSLVTSLRNSALRHPRAEPT
jgi:hypothetical protein